MYSWVSSFLKKRCSSLAIFLQDLLDVCSSGSREDGGGAVSVVGDGVSAVSMVGGGISLNGCVADGLSALLLPMFFLLSKKEFLSKNKAIAKMTRRTTMVVDDRFVWILRFVFFMISFAVGQVVWGRGIMWYAPTSRKPYRSSGVRSNEIYQVYCAGS